MTQEAEKEGMEKRMEAKKESRNNPGYRKLEALGNRFR